jgi:hypothetical protein
MKRSRLNFIVDALGATGFVFLTATGVLVRYVLPPGSGHHTTVWGLDRHEWGALHFWIAVGFLGALAVHLFLHWRWILSVLRGQPRAESGTRLALGVLGLLAVLALAVAPFYSAVERDATFSPRGSGASSPNHDTESLRGRMTLSEIEGSTGVPVAFLLKHLGLPPDAPRDIGIARLGRQHGFDVDDVRRAVREYR